MVFLFRLRLNFWLVINSIIFSLKSSATSNRRLRLYLNTYLLKLYLRIWRVKNRPALCYFSPSVIPSEILREKGSSPRHFIVKHKKFSAHLRMQVSQMTKTSTPVSLCFALPSPISPNVGRKGPHSLTCRHFSSPSSSSSHRGHRVTFLNVSSEQVTSLSVSDQRSNQDNPDCDRSPEIPNDSFATLDALIDTIEDDLEHSLKSKDEIKNISPSRRYREKRDQMISWRSSIYSAKFDLSSTVQLTRGWLVKSYLGYRWSCGFEPG